MELATFIVTVGVAIGVFWNNVQTRKLQSDLERVKRNFDHKLSKLNRLKDLAISATEVLNRIRVNTSKIEVGSMNMTDVEHTYQDLPLFQELYAIIKNINDETLSRCLKDIKAFLDAYPNNLPNFSQEKLSEAMAKHKAAFEQPLFALRRIHIRANELIEAELE